MIEILEKAAALNGLVTAFAIVGFIVLISGQISRRLTFGRVHGSAIAIVIGLALAYWGGTQTGGHKGLADMSLFGGIGLMGGAMLRDFAIVATAFEVQATEARKAGMIGVVALVLGTVLPFIVGAAIAWSFGYSDAVSMTTIGAGADCFEHVLIKIECREDDHLHIGEPCVFGDPPGGDGNGCDGSVQVNVALAPAERGTSVLVSGSCED